MKKQIVTIEELLTKEIDIDIYEETSGLEIAFCGPVKLTEKGKKRYKRILDIEVEIKTYDYGSYSLESGFIDTDDEEIANLIYDFFYSVAGWCPASNYDAWFILE